MGKSSSSSSSSAQAATEYHRCLYDSATIARNLEDFAKQGAEEAFRSEYTSSEHAVFGKRKIHWSTSTANGAETGDLVFREPWFRTKSFNSTTYAPDGMLLAKDHVDIRRPFGTRYFNTFDGSQTNQTSHQGYSIHGDFSRALIANDTADSSIKDSAGRTLLTSQSTIDRHWWRRTTNIDSVYANTDSNIVGTSHTSLHEHRAGPILETIAGIGAVASIGYVASGRWKAGLAIAGASLATGAVGYFWPRTWAETQFTHY